MEYSLHKRCSWWCLPYEDHLWQQCDSSFQMKWCTQTLFVISYLFENSETKLRGGVLQKLPWVAYLFFTRLILLLLLGATAASYGLWTNTLKLKLHCNLHNIFLSKTVNQSPRGSHVIWWKRNEKIWSPLLQKIASHTILWILIEFSMASNKKTIKLSI